MRLLRFVIEFLILLALVPIVKLQRLYKLRAIAAVDEDHWTPINLTKEQLLDRTKAWFEVVCGRSIDFEPKTPESVERRFFRNLSFVLSRGVGNHETAKSRVMIEHQWAQRTGCKLFDPHVNRSSFMKDEQASAIVYLANET